MSSDPRVLRVFVSSTFQDMHGEREVLAKQVFPQLRELCARRGVVFIDVDLRWGITGRQLRRGSLLPICLTEVERSRPFFLGLLGQRYGSILGEIPPDLLASRPWLADHRQSSVTELECMHGVLNDPSRAPLALFYLRDPDYARRLDPARRGDFVERDPAARRRLASLKRRIRESGLPVREGYEDPEHLGELVLRDLTAAIDRRFPPGSAPDPLEREEVLHSAFLESRTGVYVGRRADLARLDAHVRGIDGLLAIVGEPGAGKSALLANWLTRYRAAQPRDPVVTHFVGAGGESADWRSMLHRLSARLQGFLELSERIPESREGLETSFANLLHRADARARREGLRVVLVLDALDQLEDREGAADLVWLPREIPHRIRLIVSTQPGRSLDRLEERSVAKLVVERLAPAERLALTWRFLRPYRKRLPRTLRRRLALSDAAANPLYLRTLLDELRIYGDRATLEGRLERYLEAETVPELFDRILERFEEDYEAERPGLVGEAMSLLWAARRGLTEPELLELLGREGAPLPRARWAPLQFAVAGSLIDRGGLLGFAHSGLRSAVEARYLGAEGSRREAHRRLADHFFEIEDVQRLLDEVPHQLCEGGDWSRLAALLGNPRIAAGLLRVSRSDVKRYWRLLERESSLRMPEVYARVISDPGSAALDHALAVSDLLDETSHPAAAAELLERLERHCREGRDAVGRHACLNRLGLLRLRERRVDEALEAFSRCQELARNLDDAAGEKGAVLNSALALEARGEGARAARLLDDCIEFFARSGAPDSLSRSLLPRASLAAKRGELEEADRLSQWACDAARATGDRDLVQETIRGRAALLYSQGRTAAGERLLREAQESCRRLGDSSGLAWSLDLLGVYQKAQGDYAAALALQRESAALHRRLGSRSGLASALGNQAETLIRMERLEEARAPNERSIELYRELGEIIGLATSLLNHAVLRRADPEAARALLREAWDLYEAAGDLEGRGRVLALRAELLAREGDASGAEASLQQGIDLLSAAGVGEGLAALHLQRGALLQEQPGRDGEAREDLERALEISTSSNFRHIASDVLQVVAESSLERNELEVALTAAHEWIHLASARGRFADVQRARLIASECLCRLGRLRPAESVTKLALAAAREAGDPESTAAVLHQLARIRREGGRTEAAAVALEEAEALFRQAGLWEPAATCMLSRVQILAFDLNRGAEASLLLESLRALARRHGLGELERRANELGVEA